MISLSSTSAQNMGHSHLTDYQFLPMSQRVENIGAIYILQNNLLTSHAAFRSPARLSVARAGFRADRENVISLAGDMVCNIRLTATGESDARRLIYIEHRTNCFTRQLLFNFACVGIWATFANRVAKTVSSTSSGTQASTAFSPRSTVALRCSFALTPWSCLKTVFRLHH